MEHPLEKTIIIGLLVFLWLWVAFSLIEVWIFTPLYIGWILLGLTTVAALISRRWFHQSLKAKLIVALLVICLTPIFSYISITGYWSYNEKRTYQALDHFIQDIVASGTFSPEYQLGSPDPQATIEKGRPDFSTTYDMIFTDHLLGEYDIVVKFDNGSKYNFNIGDYGGYWDVSLHKLN